MSESEVSRRLRAAVAAAVIPLPGESPEQPQPEDVRVSKVPVVPAASESGSPAVLSSDGPSLPPQTQTAEGGDVGSPAAEPPQTTAPSPVRPAAPRLERRPAEHRPAPGPSPMRPRGGPEPKRIMAGAIAAMAVLAVASWLASRESRPDPATTARVDVSPRPPTPAPVLQPPGPSTPVSPEPAGTPAAARPSVREPAGVDAPRRESGGRRPEPQPLEVSPAVGSLRIRSVSGARVFVDGTEYTPLGPTGELTITDVPVGAHNIRVAVGAQEVTIPATVVASRETALEANLTPPPAPVAAIPEPPAPIVRPPVSPNTSSDAPAAWAQAFEFAQWPWTQYVHIGPNELRYERRTSAGRVDSDAVVASCSEIEGVRPGAFGGGMSIRLKNGAKVDISRASKQQISQLQEALERACRQR